MDFYTFESNLMYDFGIGDYSEVKLNHASIVVQMMGAREWKFQFYKTSSYPVVEAEFIMQRGEVEQRFAYDALMALEHGTEMDWNIIKSYSPNLIIIRKTADGYKREECKILSFNRFREYAEELAYDEDVVKLVDGAMNYSQVMKVLREYGVERG